MTVVRHTSATKARVVELHEAGWGPTAIARLLDQEGRTVPTALTIWRWTHPEQASRMEARHIAKRRRWRVERASFRWPGLRGPEWRIGRMRALRDEGLSMAAIARVMSYDFPDCHLSEHQVSEALAGRVPVPLRRLA